MSSSSTVSAVITTYNYGEFIVDAIESVLAQTRPADEIIVVDDGSTDSTPALVAPYVERGVVHYIQQQNQGPSIARNRGVEESSGALIAFLDADDIWMPRKLELQVAWLERHPEAALVSGQMIWWHVPNDERKLVEYRSMPQARLRRELAVRNVAGNPSMMLIRRSAFVQSGGYDPTLRWGQDWEIVNRLVKFGTVGFVQEPVITYRWHRRSLSHEGRREQIEGNLGISRRAIRTFDPAWRRPLLLLRAWSMATYERARIADLLGDSRSSAIRNALVALMTWPFDDPRARVMLLGRAIFGERTYSRARAGLRSRIDRAR